LFLFALLTIFTAKAQTADPPPYAAIACPLPDTMDQLLRDSINLKFSPIRLNQAGYRPQDEKLFYYVGTSASNFSVINATTGAVAGTGTLTSLGVQAPGQFKITCYYKAQLTAGGDIKYQLLGPQYTGTVYKGLLPDLPEGRYKVVVGTNQSAPFVIRADVYSMVKDALLKYYGVARCGPNESWFHAGCHLKDPVPGGWHDAGDHIKVPQSNGFAFAVLGLCAAALKDRDQDHYAKNQSLTLITDGIPDVLVEAKVGADFMVKSYDLGGGTVAGMKTDIGDFGKDHGWWGRPEYQDAMGPDRGGPPRPGVQGLGGNTAGSLGAGLAFVGKLWAAYDAAYSAKCIKIAKELYAFGKANQTAYQNAAMNGNDRTNDELALAALALWWATKDSVYKNDLLYDKTIGPAAQPALYPKGGFSGGWFTHKQAGMFKDRANTSWADLDAYPLWGLFRLILIDEATALSYGISAAERLNLIEDILYCQISNISDISDGDQSITLPAPSFQWKQGILKCGSLWGWMMIQQDWMVNRYQAGNITELFCYYDIASKMQGVELPNSPATTDWKVNDVKSVLIKQLDYMLGMNPWDVSMIVGVGAKNLNHPHHRASDPELQNVPGAFYKYRPPVGALSAGYYPTVPLYDEFMGGNANPWLHSEISLDATTAIFLPVMGLAKEDTLAAPTATVRTVYVGCDSAIIEVRLSRYGTSTIRYGASATSLGLTKSGDSSGVFQRIALKGLTKGTTYYFNVLVQDLFNRQSTILDLDQDKNQVPFKFTTLSDCSGSAQITNVKVCKVTGDSAEIFWYTPNGEFDSKVTYDTVKPPTRFTAYDVETHPVKFHFVKIGGLREKTTYYFSVQSGAAVDNNNGQYYQFTTTVQHVDFDIRAVRYDWAGKPALGINVINQDVRTYDSLDFRLYFRAKDGFENDLGARFDIIIKYQANGYQDQIIGALKDTIQKNLQWQKPTKMTDTYNPADGTYAYYFSLPLWGVEMQSQSRIRMDVIFVQREPTRLVDLLDQPPLHQINNADWSFGPHTDPMLFPGIPIGTKDDVDANYWSLPIDYYITVYRKGEYVWGYSPSAIEQQQKKNYYTLKTQVTSPLTNPSQDYVFFERSIPVVNVSGWATIEPIDGAINDIWVNGARLVNPGQYVQWNQQAQRFDFTVPVPVTGGRNNADITFFAGPSTCDQCYGCAVSNHSFFIEFRGAKQYPSTLKLIDLGNQTIPSGDTAHIDTTVFNVVVSDLNGNINPKGKDTLYVTITNPTAGDSLYARLIETGDSTGIFQTQSPIPVVSAKTGPFQIIMSPGDNIYVKYIDPSDPTDSSSAHLISKADFPLAVRGWLLDANGDGRADSAVVVYNKALAALPDSLRFSFPDTSSPQTVKAGQGSLRFSGATVTVSFGSPFAVNTTAFSRGSQGTAASYFTLQGMVKKNSFPVADSVGPVVTSAQAVERLGKGIDTVYIAFSEAITQQSLIGPSLILIKNGASYIDTVTAFQPLSGGVYAVSLSTGSAPPQAGDSLRINAPGPLRDQTGNAAHPLNRPVSLGIKQIPASIVSGYYLDRDADGVVDAAIVLFNKKVGLSTLSFLFDWGNNIIADNVRDSSLSYVGGDSTVVAVILKNAFSPSPGVKTSGIMLVTPFFSLFPGGAQNVPIADSAAPVIKAAAFLPDMGPGPALCDTLQVDFSEEVVIAAVPSPFNFISSAGNAPYSLTLVQIGGSSRSARFCVAQEGVTPKAGDSIWINPLHCVSDSGHVYQTNIRNRRASIAVQLSQSLWKDPVISRNPFTPGLSVGRDGWPQGIGMFIGIFPKRQNGAMDLTARMTIFDVLGNCIHETSDLVNYNNGYFIPWNGINRIGRTVSSGVYQANVIITGADGKPSVYKLRIGVKR